jgi:hypothetical protein
MGVLPVSVKSRSRIIDLKSELDDKPVSDAERSRSVVEA